MNFTSPTRRSWLTGLLAAVPAVVAAGSTRQAPPLLLAHDAPADVDPAGWLVSEKLDGVRAFWDGRSLVFRSGLAIAAPHWFIERLPATPLDGELWLARGKFEALSGLVRSTQADDARWRSVHYVVFEQPGGAGTFAQRAIALQRIAAAKAWPQLVAADQAQLEGRAQLASRLNAVVQAGGEGLMLHHADAPYLTGRQPVLLKLKPFADAEAEVIAHLPGQGRHSGRLGALRVRDAQGRIFQLGSGFSDAQRDEPPPVGSTVSYRYRGTTAGGLPRFAAFMRVRDDGG